MMRKSFVSVLVAGVVAAGLSVVGVPAASAGSAASSGVTITSSRSFPKVNTARRDVLKESVSTDGDGASWGGVDSLDVPQTKSQAERDAEAAAKKAEEERKAAEEAARQEAARLAEAQAASRSSSRTSLTTTAPAASADTPTDVAAFVKKALSVQGSAYRVSGYVWTGDPSTSSFTCSGVVDYALGRSTNSSWPESLYAEVGSNLKMDVADLNYGDLVFGKYDGRSPGHVGIYLGNGVMLDSAPDGGVAIRPVTSGGYFMGGGPII
ncbi:NlpC/P60 family protein [Bifidobacterium leontopitheci]|nr:NlpC/P60 family protein [Bifidobacterium leontopitheci]